MDKISHFNKISNIRYTRSGSLIIHTTDATCAIEACRISTFMGVPESTRIVWEDITNRFLDFDIQVDVFLADLANEMTNSNDISVLELRRFFKKNSQAEFSPVLITCLGTYMPSELKFWFTVKHIQQFVDRPRQCSKCFLFNHASSKFQKNQLCVNCGTQHEEVCTSPVSCPNCKGEHRADRIFNI